MRRLIILLILLVPLVASGQDSAATMSAASPKYKFKVRVGAMAGLYVLPYTAMNGSRELKMSSVYVPYYYGGFVEMHFNRRLAVQVEGYHQSMTWEWEYGSSSIHERAAYFPIAVVPKLKLGIFSIYFGYQYAIFNYGERKLISVSDDYETKWYAANAFYAPGYSALIGGAEVTLFFGLGWHIRYVHALDNIIDTTAPEVTTIYEGSTVLKPSGVMVGMHYSIGRGRRK